MSNRRRRSGTHHLQGWGIVAFKQFNDHSSHQRHRLGLVCCGRQCLEELLVEWGEDGNEPVAGLWGRGRARSGAVVGHSGVIVSSDRREVDGKIAVSGCSKKWDPKGITIGCRGSRCICALHGRELRSQRNPEVTFEVESYPGKTLHSSPRLRSWNRRWLCICCPILAIYILSNVWFEVHSTSSNWRDYASTPPNQSHRLANLTELE